jgi:hypothetical protein
MVFMWRRSDESLRDGDPILQPNYKIFLSHSGAQKDFVDQLCGDPILQPNHKIFLSYSGAQKDFVDQLCGDLEKFHHFPFYDKRPSSLPKGERFPELILKAAQECQMAVVVVSEEYFLSKWPMTELHAFVQARLKSNTKLKIFPLFYKLSVSEFGNKERRDQWVNEWEEWAKTDLRINVNAWKDSLKVLASFNGIEYNQGFKGIEAYLKSIVSNICKEVKLDIKWDDSHVQGCSNICQVLFFEKLIFSTMSKTTEFGKIKHKDYITLDTYLIFLSLFLLLQCNQM